uniref:Eukaryotic translation initiation factor 2A n=1 Tax=Ficedula albicollis TaxID=59894 RepID=U3JRR8_FICAL
MVNGPPSFTESTAFQRDSGKNCKAVAFSKDGSLFAWCNGQKVNVVNITRAELLHSFDLPKTVCLEFSPKNNVLATWQAYTTAKDGTAGVPNLQLHDLRTGKCLKSFIQKKMQNWCPCWADDESICARNVNNEVHFFENNNFNTIANKLHLQKVSDFVLSPGAQPTKVAVYVPGSKGAPSFVRLYQYPNFGGPQSALANKSFFKADKVTMLWNKKATAVLVVASTEVDKSGASYYGEQTLHYVAASGESAVVQLPKSGPIYDVAWSPNSVEFCAVYGFMPAKATVFNLKCDPVFDFGTGPRNAAYYSPQGHVLVLAGFGNLRGQMEVWDVRSYRLLSKPVAADSTYFAWCPDGEHMVTATCAPRLRVGNGYKHEDEPPQNMKPQLGGGDKPVSKTALKNQRKHEAKKAAKQVLQRGQSQSSAWCTEMAFCISFFQKLKAIEQLKEQAAAGKQLEKNQVEKIQKEAALLKELEDLELGV